MINKKPTTSQIALAVAIATFSSNILGFLRETLLANYYGAGMITDAYVMGIAIPTTLMAAVISAMSTAFMPVLASKFEKDGPNGANKFTSRIINLTFIFVAVVFVLSFIFSDFLVGLFAPGYAGEKKLLTIFYMRIAFVTLFCTVGTSFLDAYLKYCGIFAPQKFIAVLQNVFAIVGIVVAAKGDHHLLIVGFVLGYIVSFIGQLILALGKGYKHSLSISFTADVKEILLLALPVFIGGSFSELNTFIDKMLASSLTEGSVTALNYSGKLVNIIMTFTVGIFTTIIYPKLNQAFVKGEYDRVSSLCERGINLLSLVSIPFTLGAVLYATPLVKIVFERGAFSSTATGLVAISFMFYVMRIPFYAVSQLVTNTFYAMHNTSIAVVCSIVAVGVNIGLNFALVGPLDVAGLAIATSVAELVGMITRVIMFKKKYSEVKLLSSKRKLAKIVLFSIIAVGVSYIVYLICGFISTVLIRLGLAVIAAMIIYLLLLYIAKFEELGLIKDLFKRGK